MSNAKSPTWRSLNLGATGPKLQENNPVPVLFSGLSTFWWLLIQFRGRILRTNKHEAILWFPSNHTGRSWTVATGWASYLWAGGQVVVDCERNFGLLPSDQAVGQREVNKEVLEGAKLAPAGQAQALLLRQGHGFRHPRGDGIWHVQSQLGLPALRTAKKVNFLLGFLSAWLKSQM